MSSPVLIHHPGAEVAFGLPKVPTLAEVLDALDADPSLPPRQRADLRSAVITVGARARPAAGEHPSPAGPAAPPAEPGAARRATA